MIRPPWTVREWAGFEAGPPVARGLLQRTVVGALHQLTSGKLTTIPPATSFRTHTTLVEAPDSPGTAVNFYSLIVTSLGGLSFVATAVAILLFAGLAVPAFRSGLRERFRGLDRTVLGWATLIALAAVSGSLYFSEIVGFIPCRLCWFQRIAMYPLLPVLAVAVLRSDVGVWRYALPLSILGFAISAYHVAVQRLPAVEPAACGEGVPCSAIYVAVFQIVSIPVMAGSAFLAITALLLLTRTLENDPGSDRIETL